MVVYTFFVLTDYAQKVDIGRDFNNNNFNKISISLNTYQTDLNSDKARTIPTFLKLKYLHFDFEQEIQKEISILLRLSSLFSKRFKLTNS